MQQRKCDIWNGGYSHVIIDKVELKGASPGQLDLTEEVGVGDEGPGSERLALETLKILLVTLLKAFIK